MYIMQTRKQIKTILLLINDNYFIEFLIQYNNITTIFNLFFLSFLVQYVFLINLHAKIIIIIFILVEKILFLA